MVNRSQDSSYRREVVTLAYATMVAYGALAIFSYNAHDNTLFYFSSTVGGVTNWAGALGANIAAILFFLWGTATYVIWAALLFPLYRMLRKTSDDYDARHHGWLLLGSVFVTATMCSLYGIAVPAGAAGGLIGMYLERVIVAATGNIGSQLLLWSMLMMGIMLFMHVPLFAWCTLLLQRGRAWCSNLWHALRVRKSADVESCEGAIKIDTFDEGIVAVEEASESNAPETSNTLITDDERVRYAACTLRTTLCHTKIFQTPVVVLPNSVLSHNIFAYDDDHADSSLYEHIFAAAREGKKTASFQLPDVALLNDIVATRTQESSEQLERRARKVEEKLQHFGINGSVVAIKPGPVVTMFEYKPEIDSKISKILALEDDLAMALSAQSMRILAPIPGRNVIGFEIANEEREAVSFARLIKNAAFDKSAAQLPVALGLDRAGEPVIEDLASMPHLLVGGATGSGKSVGLNTLVLSLLYKKTPEELKLILIDPKRLEFTPYADIPHLLFPVVTQPARAALVLAWVAHEMDTRYTSLAAAGVRSIAEYNKLTGPEHRAMSYIVVIIDELADLMMVAGKEVEAHIVRIAQMARAAGIHMVLATQRPSVEVVTGLIKVNFPSRVAFRVSSKVDSRTILDTQGAEKLLGRGDMLWMQASSSDLKRVHGALVTDGEVERVVDHLRDQQQVQYVELDEISLRTNHGSIDDIDDELYDQVRTLISTMDEISISMIQRHYRIGFNRSARLIEKLEMDGLIAPAQGSKPRKVLHGKA
ncbi:MAG: DNA translocase FtsK [Candidatus Babeliales bacterium]|jgi:S-DNA-T family DNA segregation ATPase FtsK/SpoIIIE